MAVLALACGTTAAGESVFAVRPQADVRAEVFAAAVRGVQERWPHLQRIDPRPIDLTRDLRLPSEADYYRDSANLELLRRTILEELGIEAITAFPLLDHCTGLLVPPAHRETQGCPTEERFDLAFDRARPADESDRWKIRMLEIDYRPYGRSATLLELSVALEGATYRLERAEILVSWD